MRDGACRDVALCAKRGNRQLQVNAGWFAVTRRLRLYEYYKIRSAWVDARVARIYGRTSEIYEKIISRKL